MDQYYTTEVNYILDTVVERLLENPDRKFSCMLLIQMWGNAVTFNAFFHFLITDVETGFFERWWIQQSPTTQAMVKTLVNNGQLEFINGA